MERNKEKKTKTRSQVQRMLLLQRLGNEKMLLLLLFFAFAYSLASNIISKCCPIDCDPQWANIGNALDDVIKNISYGIFVGVFFYIVNDVYKNVVEKTKNLNRIAHELFKLQFHAYSMVYDLCDEEYDKNMSEEQLFQCIMTKLCNEDDEFHLIGSILKTRHISTEKLTFLIDKWEEANTMRNLFLNTYGDLITRDEFFNLNGFGNSWASVLIRRGEELIRNFDREEIDVNDRDIAGIVNCIVRYKFTLTDLTRKYLKYSYSIVYLNRSYIEDDIH